MKKNLKNFVKGLLISSIILSEIIYAVHTRDEAIANNFDGGYYVTLMHEQGLSVAIKEVNEAITIANTVEERNALMQMRRVLPMLEEK